MEMASYAVMIAVSVSPALCGAKATDGRADRSTEVMQVLLADFDRDHGGQLPVSRAGLMRGAITSPPAA
ncbi:hypothetical protein Bwad006_02240 [Bilophila wadsworthia]